jgi:hypothetical protein
MRRVDPVRVFLLVVSIVAAIGTAACLLWLASMSAHAGTCPWMPSFDGGGVVCTPAHQLVECRCSECFTWDDPSVPEAVARWFNIWRRDPGGAQGIVGTLSEEPNDDPDLPPNPPRRVWCFAKDSTMPREGQPYWYMVEACNSIGCADLSAAIEYVAAPYAINSFRPPVKGN